MKLTFTIFILILVILFSLILYKCFEPFHLSPKQTIFKKTLEDMANILDKNDIPFFLFCGTALGCHREGNFIEHDQDIDLGVFDNISIEKIIQILQKYPNIFKLSRTLPHGVNISEATEATFTHLETDVEIDIFQVHKGPSKYYFYTYTDVCDDKPNKRCEYAYKPFKLQTKKFLGRKYFIPPISHVKERYGDTWNVPQDLSYHYMAKKYSNN